jgi:hypothetical protein
VIVRIKPIEWKKQSNSARSARKMVAPGVSRG